MIVRALVITLLVAGVSYGLIYYGGTKFQTLSKKAVVGLTGQPLRINPLWAANNSVDQALAKVIYPGLVTFDAENKPAGDLAERWEISEDGKTYTVYLKSDKKWDDGKPVTADDVVFTYKITQSEEYTGREKKRFQDVALEIVNTSTIKFTLQEPFSPFLESLNLGILPRHIWDKYHYADMKNAEYNLKPVGSGAYAITDIKTDNNHVYQLSLTPRDAKDKRLSQIVVRFYSDEEHLSSAFKLGEIDSFLTFDRDLYNQYTSWNNAQISQTQVCGQSISLFLNATRSKTHPLQSNEFKDALMTTLNQPQLSIVAKNFPSTSNHWAFESKNVVPNLTKDQIQEIFLKNNFETPYILVTPDTELSRDSAQSVVELLTAYGLKIQMQAVSSEELQSNILPERKFDFLLVFQQFGHDPDQYAFWHSSQVDITKGGLNVSGYANRPMDKILEDGRTKTDLEARKEIYHQFEQKIIEDRPALFLNYPIFYEVGRVHSNKLLTKPCIWHEADYLLDSVKP